MNRIVVINGPNLNLLGSRETSIYGNKSLKDVKELLSKLAEKYGVIVEMHQSNHEGAIIDWLHAANTDETVGIIINPGAFTHYSYAIRDAISAIGPAAVEVHISNVYAREEFRKYSVIAPVCVGQIAGFGLSGYQLAFHSFFAMN